MSTNPRDYGAAGDGATDDTAPFEAAATASGGVLRVPQGQYILKRRLNVRAVQGEGIGVTELRWPSDATSAGLRFAPAVDWQHNLCRDMTLSTGVAAPAAICLDYSAQVVDVGSGNMFTMNHFSPRFYLENLLLCGIDCVSTGSPFGVSWQQGVDVIAAVGGVINAVTYVGQAASPWGAAAGTGFLLRGTNDGLNNGHPDQIILNDCTAHFAVNGIVARQCEGIFIRAANMVACTNGISITSTGSHPQANIRDSHVNCGAVGISINGQRQASVAGCLIYCIQQPVANFVGLYLINCDTFQALGNSFASVNASGYGVNHLVAAGASYGTIDNNTYLLSGNNPSAAIWLQSTAHHIKIGPSNIFDGAFPYPILNQGSNNTIIT